MQNLKVAIIVGETMKQDNQSVRRRKCYECQTELELWDESMGNGLWTTPIWYCPTCKAGCGYVDD